MHDLAIHFSYPCHLRYPWFILLRVLNVFLNSLFGCLVVAVGGRTFYLNKEDWFGALQLIGGGCINFIVVPVVARIICEFLVLFFQMNETLADIHANILKAK